LSSASQEGFTPSDSGGALFEPARFAAHRAFIAADNSARRSAEMLSFRRFLPLGLDTLRELALAAAALSFFGFFFFVPAVASLRRSFASFFVSFSIRSVKRRIFLFKFFAFTVI
jgi:hypothetical protein